MSSDKKLKENPMIIAIDYYDGVIEGLTSSIDKYSNCYFKLIAWDKDQDMRLYVFFQPYSSEYGELVTLVYRNEKTINLKVRLPNWELYNKNDRKVADKLIESFRSKLTSSTLFAYGKDIQDRNLKITKIESMYKDRIDKVLKLNKPDDISNWLVVKR